MSKWRTQTCLFSEALAQDDRMFSLSANNHVARVSAPSSLPLPSSYVAHGSNIPYPGMLRSVVQCPYCVKVLLDQQILKTHISQEHGNAMPYPCSLCGKGYLSQMGLNHHMQRHKGQTFSCPVCDSKFTQKYSVIKHLKNVHMSSRCNTCSLVFKIGPEFNQHILFCQPNTSNVNSVPYIWFI